MPSLLLGAIIFFSATQFGLHFWPSSALVYGIRVDYLSPTLYFLDCLIVIYLFLQPKLSLAAPALLAPLLLTNLMFSHNALATLSWSLHLLLYASFLFTVPAPLLKSALRSILPLAILFQVFLALTQVVLGHSVGGLLYYLGERTVAVGSPGVALATFMDNIVLRAYASFSHPNVLAGWLVVSLLVLLRLGTKWRLFVAGLVVLGVLLTQSRTAALVLFGFILPLYLLKQLSHRALYFGAIIFLAFSFSLATPARSDLSLRERLNLQQVSLSIITQYPIFGTGAQASLSAYPAAFAQTNSGFRLLQPDHNSFALFISWFGVLGALALIYLARYSVSRYTLAVILPLLPLLLFDHYLLTSPQGLFALILYLKVCNFDTLKIQ